MESEGTKSDLSYRPTPTTVSVTSVLAQHAEPMISERRRADLTDEEDPFAILSGGRALFRVVDLLALAELIEEVWS